MKHKRTIIIACALLATAAVLTTVLVRSAPSPKGPARVASVQPVAAARRICSTTKGRCVSGCLLPVAAVIPTHARSGECPLSAGARRPCRLLISSEQGTPPTGDRGFCASDELLIRRLRGGSRKPSPRARR